MAAGRDCSIAGEEGRSSATSTVSRGGAVSGAGGGGASKGGRPGEGRLVEASQSSSAAADRGLLGGFGGRLGTPPEAPSEKEPLRGLEVFRGLGRGFGEGAGDNPEGATGRALAGMLVTRGVVLGFGGGAGAASPGRGA